MENEGKCALWDRLFEPKERSHIVSKFVYQWLKYTSATGFMRFGPQVNRRDQDGIKDYFLCEQCEDRASRRTKRSLPVRFFIHSRKTIRFASIMTKTC